MADIDNMDIRRKYEYYVNKGTLCRLTRDVNASTEYTTIKDHKFKYLLNKSIFFEKREETRAHKRMLYDAVIPLLTAVENNTEELFWQRMEALYDANWCVFHDEENGRNALLLVPKTSVTAQEVRE